MGYCRTFRGPDGLDEATKITNVRYFLFIACPDALETGIVKVDTMELGCPNLHAHAPVLFLVTPPREPLVERLMRLVHFT
jgi:hypothetical protein